MIIVNGIVYTYSDDDGHVIAEVFTSGKWMLVDPLFNIIYQKDGIAYSCIDIYENSKIINMFSGGYYCDSHFFKHIAVADYKIAESNQYNYRISRCNDYYYFALSKCRNQN